MKMIFDETDGVVISKRRPAPDKSDPTAPPVLRLQLEGKGFTTTVVVDAATYKKIPDEPTPCIIECIGQYRSYNEAWVPQSLLAVKAISARPAAAS